MQEGHTAQLLHGEHCTRRITLQESGEQVPCHVSVPRIRIQWWACSKEGLGSSVSFFVWPKAAMGEDESEQEPVTHGRKAQ